VGAEDHDTAVRHLVQLVHEHGTQVAQPFHHVTVVHHLMAHVDGRAVEFDGALDDLYGAIHARAETAGVC
jgi:hypothetical protein